MVARNSAAIIFPHQLFKQHPAVSKGCIVYLVEDPLFFSQYSFHKQKLLLHRLSMKAYATYLESQEITVRYIESKDLEQTSDLVQLLLQDGIKQIALCEVVDDWLVKRFATALTKAGIGRTVLQTPAFITSAKEIDQYLDGKNKLYFTDFYIRQRRNFKILLEQNKPVGGKWSFDAENRKSLPNNIELPQIVATTSPSDLQLAELYVANNFIDATGSIDNFIYPTTHEQAEAWLENFLDQRFSQFGDYEDAISTSNTFLFHSVLSPALNIGLLTPDQVLRRSLSVAREKKIPLNSLEGFIRQVIGWREYVRAVYQVHGRRQRLSNFFNHTRKMPSSFYDGTTGIEPFDLIVRRVLENSYCHHIERLMILGNFMLLCEVSPTAVYRWFMELFIDSYDWVMVPNIYGMSQYADGGLITTKPYISSSRYILKMSDFKPGKWCDIWDGLYWRFVAKHKQVFLTNPRSSLLVGQLDRMDAKKLNYKLALAEDFLKKLS